MPLTREELDEAVKRGFIAHLECLLQRGRRASVRHGRLVRARLIIDVDGVGLGLLRNPGVAAVFVAYQLAEGGENTPVDLLEFAVGWVLAAFTRP